MLNRRRERGLSLVEMMVGLAVGLFVVSAATLVVSSQLSSNRRLLLDTQLQQDLRVAADVITRDLRRAGSLSEAGARLGYWYPQPPAVTTATTSNAQRIVLASTTQVTYRYQRNSAGGLTNAGFRLSGTKLQSFDGSSWQDLTDDTVMRVTAFTITPNLAAATVIPCPNDCPGGGQACWPTVQVRRYTIDIAAQATNDAAITRSLRTRVRVANDLVSTNGGTSNTPAAICPT